MKRKTITNITALFLLLLCFGAVQAQVDDKGVTSTGKEIDCFTITSEDRVVNEYGAIVTQPRLTRNGKIITDDCCPTLVESSLTDTVWCTAVSMAATMEKGIFKTGILQVFSNPDYTGQVGDDFPATLSDDRITAKAIGLSCNTHYYFKLVLNDQCEYTWTDSTRDVTAEIPTFCTVKSVLALSGDSDLSREHPVAGSSTEIDSVYDHQGNAYAVVQIGNQCWLKENMRCTTSPSENLSKGNGKAASATMAYFYDNTDDEKLTPRMRGMLYNWEGAMDTTGTLSTSAIYTNRRGICPKGWHLPTDDEWFTLETKELSGIPSTSGTAYRGTGVGKLTGGCDWTISGSGEETQPGNYFYSERNITGLFLVPAGYYNGSTFTDVCKGATLWSSTILSDGSVYYRGLKFSEPGMGRNNSSTVSAFSVRCLRNCEDTITFISNNGVDDTVKQFVVRGVSTQLLADTFTNKGNIFFGWTTQSDGQGQYYADRDFITTDGNVTLYALWNATGCKGIVRTNEIGHGNYVDTVLDYDNFKYATVQIGDQCWMRSNLRSTHYSDGTAIANYYSNNPEIYGLLYNRAAVFNGAGYSSAVPSGVQGICPSGWHLPSDNEWRILLQYVDGISDYVCGTTGTPDYPNLTSGPIAAALSANTTWNSSNTACAPGKKPETINATGFSAVAAGYNSGTSRGERFIFWTATKSVLPRIRYSSPQVEKDDPGDYNTYKYSVRCVRDPHVVTINFDANLGDGSMPAMNVVRNEATPLNANNGSITRAGWKFTGWNTSPYGDGTSYADGEEITPSVNVTLYAQWSSYCEGTLLGNEKGNDNMIDSVEDHQHNWYKVVQIGDQCWLKENMRCTSSPTGKSWTSGWSETTSKLCYTTNSAYGKDGYHYNWNAAMDTLGNTIGNVAVKNRRGICPSGWHLPTKDEWQILFTDRNAGQLSAPNGSFSGTNWNGSNTADVPGNTSDPDKNITGMSMVPSGYNTSSGVANVADFWTATSATTSTACRVYLQYNKNDFLNENNTKDYGFSVRCLRNTPDSATISFNANGGSGTMAAMNVTTMTDTALDALNGITHEGNFEFAGWNTKRDGTGTAYADGANIIPGESMTLYAQWNSWCTTASVRAQSGSDLSHEHGYNGAADKIDSVYDHEGNAYSVVQIGDQCWLKENMRATTEPNGTNILQNTHSGYSYSAPRAYYYNDDVTNVAKYGCLYNFPGAMNINDQGTSFTYHHRGICPEGWHVPTNDEWTTLTSSAQVGVGSGTGAGKLAGGSDWNTTGAATTGPADYSYAERNITGFSALPAGNYTGSNFGSVREHAYFWSATPDGVDNAYNRYFYYSKEHMLISKRNRGYGFSVRCVRDAQAKNYCTVDLKLDNEEGSVDGRIDSVADHEGNWYKVVEIGNQCWLAENMRATTEPTDPTTSIVFNSSVGSSSTEPRAFYYLNNEANYAKYGALYNFPATMNYTGDLPAFVHPHRGICPEGWHVPEDAEWTTMERTVAPEATNLHNNFNSDCLVNNSDFQASDTPLAVELSGGTDWQNSSNEKGPGCYYNTLRNITGFSALPAGDYRNNFYDINETTYFMSSTTWLRPGVNDNLVICRGLYYAYSGMNRNAYNLENHYSVRCVRDTPAPATISFHANGGSGTMAAMNVTTMTNTVLSDNSFTHEGNWEFRGWNTKMDGTGTAYANGANIVPTESITLYAQWHTWCDGNALSNNELGSENGRVDSVKDHQDNWYKVVQIGGQCWLKENMRATTNPDGTNILQETGSATTTTEQRAYYYNNSADNYAKYGCLYNWPAAMNGATNDGARGICPMGWHVPTDGDWTTLTNTVGVNSGTGVGKLVGGCYWFVDSTFTTSPGNYSYADRNVTGFSALPAGGIYSSAFNRVGEFAYFWSTLRNGTLQSNARWLGYNYEHVGSDLHGIQDAYSVRCVRNN